MKQEIIFVGDIVEENGKTMKENNSEIMHKLPLGSLVEIIDDCDDDEADESDRTKGIRLFVVDHCRDCDGTPLYGLSFSLSAKRELDKVLADIDNKKYESEIEWRLLSLLKWRAQGSILSGYSEDSLELVK